MPIPAEDDSRLYLQERQPVLKEQVAENFIERWANAEALIKQYPAGTFGISGMRTFYEYPAGRRLIISGEQVMDTCESPWAAKTIDNAFASEGIRNLPREYKIKVLERGAGLNIAGSRVIQKMVGRGSGEYHVIELNKKVADEARRWKDNQMEQLENWKTEQGLDLNIDIQIHEGDSFEITRRLVTERKKFNIIISDTFPLTPEEKGLNDIADLETLKKGLYGGAEGVFAFFAYYPGWENGNGNMRDSEIRVEQQRLLDRHFRQVHFDSVEVKPAPGYDYLFTHGKPVRKLPVVTATYKR